MTATSADAIIEEILKAEGGYVNDPRDRGGETNWGITVAVARKNGWTGQMRNMPRDFAKGIYLNRYYIEPGFGDVFVLSPDVALELMDTGVNMGPRVASTFLQRSLNALNNQGRAYPDIIVDGDVGPATIRALHAFIKWRGKSGIEVLLKALNCLQGERYIELAEKRQKNEAFLYGWLRTRVALP